MVTAGNNHMANACFRCRTSISSGGTFCRTCRSEVSLSEATFGGEDARWWILVAVGALASVLPIVVLTAMAPVESSTMFLVTAASILFGMVAYLGGIYADVRFLQRRDDLGWEPGDWYMVVLLTLGVFMLAPIGALVHVLLRWRRVGLPH